MASNSNPNTSSSQSLVYQQIEKTAGYYLPSVYKDLLTYHHSLTLQTDSVAQQFIPVSDAMNNPDQKKKLFVIGLIPPSSQVSGNLLDRTQSVATKPTPTTPTTLTQADQLSAQGNGIVSGTGGYGWHGQITTGVPGTNQGPAIVTQMTYPQMGAAFRDAYVQRFQTQPTQQQVAMFVGQSLRENSGGWPNYNPGNIGNYSPGTKYGDSGLANHQTFSFVNPDGSVAYYNSYATAQAGAAAFIGNIYKCGGQTAIDAAASGDVQGYCQALHDGGYFTDTVDNYAGHFANLNFVSGQIGNVSKLDSSILPPPLALGPKTQVDPSTSGDWNSTGSDAANQNTRMQATAAQNGNLGNDTNTGNKFINQQKAMVAATQQLLQQMAKTPPLRFLVNPSSFKVGNEKVIADGGWTRYGPQDIVEHWGDNQDKIDASGKLAAFQAIDLTTDAAGPGITRTARHYSAAYQNFLSLYHLYRNNAGLYLTDNIEPSDTKKQNMSVVGSIYIYFDHTMYIGSFDSFTITETDTAPYTLEYSFTFTVRATFGLDQVADPNYTYGIPQGGFTVQTSQSIPTTQAATLDSGQPASDAESAGNEAFYTAFNNGASVADANAARLQTVQQTLVNGVVPTNNRGS